MAAKWPGQNPQTQYQYQQAGAYQQPAANYSQQVSYQQNTSYNAAAYQQYYAQQYGAAQGYQQQAWTQGQYPQQYPQQAGWPQQYVTGHQQQQLQYPQQPAVQSTSTPWPSNVKGVSCYNCGAKDHWAASCPRPSRSSYGYTTPATVTVPPAAATATITPHTTQVPSAHKGPVVTKYAVPPHVAAQMKARGVPGAAAVAPALPGSAYGSQYPGWQPWHGQNSSQTMYQPQLGMQGFNSSYAYPPQQYAPAQIPPSTTVTQPGLPVSSATEATSLPAETKPTEQPIQHTEQSTTADEHPTPDTEKKEDQEEDVEDDLTSLDIPDMPKSYGTPAYVQPKLVSKPVYALAPEWTQSGYGEITICYDPDGRTESDYMKHDDTESFINSVRTAANDEDPIFATIDLDAPATIDTRSESRESRRSEFETPLTYESGETGPTSIDEADDNYTRGHRRKSGTPIYHKHNRHDGVSPRRNSHDNYQRHNRKERRGSHIIYDKKRKHEYERQSSSPKEYEPQAKKSRPEAAPAESQPRDS